MKCLVFLSVILHSLTLTAQTSPDYQKLSKACEVWGLIKYFHPGKPGPQLDSAFAAQVPRMLTASNDNDWATVFNELLSVLHDPATRVVYSGKQSGGEFTAEFTQDSVLYVRLFGFEMFDDFGRAQSIMRDVIAKAELSKGIIFDLRNKTDITKEYEGYLNSYFNYTGLSKSIATSIIPQYKSIAYSGFKAENGNTSGAYRTYNVAENGIEPGHFENKNKKVVWITNKYSELPVVCISQVLAGAAHVLNETAEYTQLLPLTNTINFSEAVSIRVRTKDLLLSSDLPLAITYSSAEDPVKKAESLLTGKIEKAALVEHVNVRNQSSDPNLRSEGYYHPYPSVGYRVLAAAKMFNVIEMFFPYHQFMDKNWKEVFVSSLHEFVDARDRNEYGLAVAKMYAHLNDSHGFIRGNLALDDLRGEAASPLSVDYIEDKVVVARFRSDSICKANNISIGDIVTKVNGARIEDLMKKYETYFAHSTPAAIKEWAARASIRGPRGDEVTYTIEDRNGKSRDVKFFWSNEYDRYFRPTFKLDTIQLISKDIGYADLTRMEGSQTDTMFEKFRNTKAIIFDMRGYPKGTAWTIAPRLTEKKDVPLALFRRNEVLSPKLRSGDILSQRTYSEFIQTVAATDKSKYKGKTVMLINHDAISQSEHSGLFFESMNNTIFVGSETAGANGDVTNFVIPGNMILYFSGQGVWHADGRQLQRVGLIPHVAVKPTIKGIRAGKDEVLEKAIQWIDKNVK